MGDGHFPGIHEVNQELELLVADAGEDDGGVLGGGDGEDPLKVRGARREENSVGSDYLRKRGFYRRILLLPFTMACGA